MVEVMKIMKITSFKSPMHALLHSVPPTLQQATTYPRLHQRLLDTQGKSGPGSRGVTAPFPWVLVLTRFCVCPPRVCSPGLCTFWRLYGGLTETSSKRASAMPRSTAPRGPAPAAGHCRPARPQETPKHSSVSVSVGSLGPGAHKVCLSPLSISGGYGV